MRRQHPHSFRQETLPCLQDCLLLLTTVCVLSERENNFYTERNISSNTPLFSVCTKLRYFPYVQTHRLSVRTIQYLRLEFAICCVQYYDSCNVGTVLVVRILKSTMCTVWGLPTYTEFRKLALLLS
jgi:hypothetical protein